MAHLGIEHLAVCQAQRLIHFASTVYERVAPALPRDGQTKDKRNNDEDDPRQVALVYSSGHDEGRL